MRRLTALCAAVALITPAVVSVASAPAAHAVTLPSLTVGDTTVWEGDAGTAVVAVPVDLSVPSATRVTVHYSITSDSATLGSDFSAKTGNLSFPANVATKALKVVVNGDTDPEQDEHLDIVLSNPNGATLDKAEGGVTIMDDDSNGVSSGVEVNVGDVSVVEANSGHHVATIPVTLSRPAPAPIKVVYAIQCGTAVDGSDYSMTSTGTLTFGKNSQTKLLSFSVAANTVPEAQIKSIVQSIRVAKGPAVVGASIGQGEIIDNDNGSGGGGGVTPLQPGEIRRVSVATDGSEAAPVQQLCGLSQNQLAGSQDEALSANGRYVAFVSDAGNLVPDDNNFTMDTFVRDTATGTTERVSVQDDGSEFPSSYSINEWQTAMDHPAISADGRYVTFVYEWYSGQLYVRDRVAGRTTMVSVNGSGQPGNGRTRYSSVSADGRYIAFSSEASDLDPANIYPPRTNVEYMYLYVRDMTLGTTRLLQRYVMPPDIGDAADMGGPTISADGRYVAFNDFSSTLVAADTNGCADTFVRDLVANVTERVSVSSSGGQQAANAAGWCGTGNRPIISSDGRYVGFTSQGLNLVPGVNGAPHAYVHDRLTGATDLVDSVGDFNPAPDAGATLVGMSDDARYVSWICFCGDPVPVGGGALDDVTKWTDRSTGIVTEIGDQVDGSVPVDDNTGFLTYTWGWGGLSADGMVVAFESHATNLVPDDANGVPDVFVERMG